MQNGGGEQNEANPAPAKRMRRPNVRLQQPYYEDPNNLRLQKQWRPFEKDMEGAKRARTTKVVTAKGKKNGGPSEGSDGEHMEAVDFDGEGGVRNWRSFGGVGGGGVSVSKDKDFKSRPKVKRVSPSTSNKKWGSVKPHEVEDQGNEKFLLSSYGDSGKEGEVGKKVVEEEEEEKLEEEEENFVTNGADRNFEPENSDPSSTDRSFGVEKSVDDDENVGGSHGKNQRASLSHRDTDEGEGEVWRRGRGDGVRVWLNQLGLGKYAPLFEVHEVDEDVLPFLTLEDLKDMGIGAVGSRRKIYRSIQKLSKESS